jgi:2-keto-3-deoxy-L-rhamnonate aldolase RhmA
VVPRVRSKTQVEEIIHTVMYPPDGVRGLAGYGCPVGKYSGWGSRQEQLETVNQNLVVGIQIETKEAIDDLDGILSVERVDMAIVGNDDLSTSLGMPGEADSPAYHSVVREVIRACERHGVLPGIPCGDAKIARYWIEQGMRMIWYGSDVAFLWSGANRRITELRHALEESSAAGLMGRL